MFSKLQLEQLIREEIRGLELREELSGPTTKVAALDMLDSVEKSKEFINKNKNALSQIAGDLPPIFTSPEQSLSIEETEPLRKLALQNLEDSQAFDYIFALVNTLAKPEDQPKVKEYYLALKSKTGQQDKSGQVGQETAKAPPSDPKAITEDDLLQILQKASSKFGDADTLAFIKQELENIKKQKGS